ncbi:hypothetical protein [Duganella sp. HH101]|uniref:hypothetical protein n=1 Tax=Duganella sp. HH101 TaxID=1781066 RepID=UPI000874A50F|nr:hypothetical protein [Duganella sp. HH101]OFA05656.1 hypothetical protein DUGA2_12350 [Duganella sp. HH101]
MDTARNKNTYELVEAEELWSMTAVDSEAYICRGCPTQVFPASYDKSRNKKRPYFTLGPTNKHIECDIDGQEKVVKRGKKERVGTPEGFPLPFPNKLTLTDERPTQADLNGLPAGMAEGSPRSRGGNDGEGRRRHHGHTVKTIRSMCRTFINFPKDREFLPLEIPGVPGDTYARVFSYLSGSKKQVVLESPTRLFYAAIRWTVDPVISQAHCDLTLHAGEWDQEKGVHKLLSRLRVNWSDWSQSRRDTLIREFETTREEAREDAKENKLAKGWIFFVGTQDASDSSLFHADNRRLICCLSGEIIWPSKK